MHYMQTGNFRTTDWGINSIHQPSDKMFILLEKEVDLFWVIFSSRFHKEIVFSECMQMVRMSHEFYPLRWESRIWTRIMTVDTNNSSSFSQANLKWIIFILKKILCRPWSHTCSFANVLESFWQQMERFYVVFISYLAVCFTIKMWLCQSSIIRNVCYVDYTYE